MAVFSTNQNRQLYVVTAVDTADKAKKADVQKLFHGTDADNNYYGIYAGAKGLIRTDLIDPATVTYCKVSAPADTEMKLKKITLSLSEDVNEGALIAGEDYIVRINFRQLYGMSDEDIYQKYGAVHVTSAMVATEGKFWGEMAYSLVKNFKNVYSPLLEIAIAGTVIERATKINGEVKLYDADNEEISYTSATSIDIIEKSQVDEWKLGTAQLTPVYFEVIPTTVYNDGEDVVWGKTVESEATETIPNGYKFADLEYFCMGERGDQYRELMFPKNIKTTYFVDPTKEYFCLDIHYAYQGTCEDIQKSEKDITFIATSDNKQAIKDIITKLKALKVDVAYTDAAEEELAGE